MERGEREELRLAYGRRVELLRTLMRGMAAYPGKWKAMMEFSKRVMDRKEEVEREEQADARRARLIRETGEFQGDVRGGGARRGAGRSLE